jgi:leucyl-tRNA synthetase
LINPLTPHIAEEMWRALGHGELLAESLWPAFDPALLAELALALDAENESLRATIASLKGLIFGA